MLLGRIKYRRDWKFVYREDDKFLRILDGSTILNIRETDRLVLYKREYMLAPVKPGKVICSDFSCIKPTTSVVSPYTPILLPERVIGNVRAKPSVVIIAGDREKRVLAWGLALNIHLKHYGDVRDYAMDTFFIMTEFLQTEPYTPLPYTIKIKRMEGTDSVQGRTLQMELEEMVERVRRFFLMYPQDAVAVDMDWTIILKPGDSITMETPLGNLHTGVMWKDEYTT